MAMEVHKLSLGEYAAIHRTMPRDFHQNEIKPLSRILWLKLLGRYSGFGAYEGSKRIGYMFFCSDGKRSGRTLLDYYVIEPEYREQGYGSRFFQKVCTSVPRLLLEVEDPAYAENDADRVHRERRIAFYQRNGCSMTSLRSNVIGERYCILWGPGGGEAGFSARAMQDFYRAIFPKKWFRQVSVEEVH